MIKYITDFIEDTVLPFIYSKVNKYEENADTWREFARRIKIESKYDYHTECTIRRKMRSKADLEDSKRHKWEHRATFFETKIEMWKAKENVK